jgi:hypothetical protein
MGREATKEDIDHANLYLYSIVNYPKDVIWTIGGSGDFYEGGNRDRDKFNPKFGFTWDLYQSTTLRGSVFRTFKRDLVSNQTLEPTQVAGFNQFFDDANATEVWQYGIAVDHKFSNIIYGGIEFTQRDLDVPFSYTVVSLTKGVSTTVVETVDWEERLGRTYFYWTPHPWFAGSFEFQYERFNRDREFSAGIKYVKTYRLPAGINFYHPSGFSIRLKGAYIDQKGKFMPQDSPTPVGPFISGDDEFFVVDGSISYRLPRRLGIIALEAKNLFDESFKYYDTDPISPSIQPESLVLIKLTLAF